jgi:acyl-CoA synthetase (NDP forming)
LDEARNVEEALAVNQELSRLESDIEVIKGRMQYLSQSAAFSTLAIDVTPDELNQPLDVGGGGLRVLPGQRLRLC